MTTVRIEDELNARLKEAAVASKPRVSVTALVTAACEAYLDRLDADVEVAPAAAARVRGREGRAPGAPVKSERRRHRHAGSDVSPVGGCVHPPGRRMGQMCLACGVEVGKNR